MCAALDDQANVVIVYRDALFARGLASILRAEGTRNVSSLHANEPAAIERIRALGPTVVILEGQEEEARVLLAPVLAATSWVIRVGLDGDAVEVYRHARITRSDPLIRLVTRLARRTDRTGQWREP